PTDELFAHGGRSGQHPTGQHHRGTLLGLTHLVHRTRKVFGRGGHDRHRGRATFLVGTTDQGGHLGQGERRGRCQLSGQGTGTLVGAVRTFRDRTPLGKDSVAHRPGERAELPTTGNLLHGFFGGPAADPERRPGIAEQPPHSVGRPDTCTCLDTGGDRTGPGDEHGTVRYGGARG